MNSSSNTTKQRGDSLLDKYDDLDSLDTQDQEAVVAELKAKNDSSNYIFRAMMVGMMGMLLFLYLTPIPSYLRGDHPENHLTLFHHGVHVQGTPEHLTYLPVLPFYLMVLALHGYVLFLGTRELLFLMGHRLGGTNTQPFPYQPHQFNTAPSWLVPAMSDIKWSPGTQTSQRSDVQSAPAPAQGQPVAATLSAPRLLYLWILLIASTPMPLMIFGAGNFANAAWWGLTTAVIALLVLVETWIVRSEKDLLGLDGMKYQHKSA